MTGHSAMIDGNDRTKIGMNSNNKNSNQTATTIYTYVLQEHKMSIPISIANTLKLTLVQTKQFGTNNYLFVMYFCFNAAKPQRKV